MYNKQRLLTVFTCAISKWRVSLKSWGPESLFQFSDRQLQMSNSKISEISTEVFHFEFSIWYVQKINPKFTHTVLYISLQSA